MANVLFPTEPQPPPPIIFPQIRYWPMVIFALISWAGVAVSYYVFPRPSPYYNLWRSRGSSGDPMAGYRGMNCTADIDGSLLMDFANDYRAVLVCGVHDQLVADSDSRSITISKPFDIENGPVLLAAPYSEAMMSTIKQQVENTRAPIGTRIEYLVSYFFYIALLPRKGTCQLSDLRSLADVSRCDGKVIAAPAYARSTVDMTVGAGF